MEVSRMCRVLGDQGLLKLGQSREDKLRRVTLNVDEVDIAFALQHEANTFKMQKVSGYFKFCLVVNTSEATLTKDIERTSRRDDGDVTGDESIGSFPTIGEKGPGCNANKFG